MNVAAIIPVKPLDRALGRLAAVLTAAERRALQEAMLSDLLYACRSCSAISSTIVVTADAMAAALSRASGAVVVADHAPPQGMNAAVAIGQAAASAAEMDAVLVLTADLPLVTAGDLHAVLSVLRRDRAAVLVPSRDGTGTNALALAPPQAIETRLGASSRILHELALLDEEILLRQLEVPALALDVDTPDDLLALVMSDHGGLAAACCDAWHVAERLGAGAIR